MRILLFITFTLIFKCSISQVPTELNLLFYDLDLSQNARNIKRDLNNDQRFESKITIDSINNRYVFERYYFGYIKEPLKGLTGKIGINPDSAIITLTFGRIGTSNKSDLFYSGSYKILNTEYFMDSANVPKFYEFISDSILNTSLRVALTSHSIKGDTFESEGQSLALTNQRKKYTEFAMFKKRYLTSNKFSVQISMKQSD